MIMLVNTKIIQSYIHNIEIKRTLACFSVAQSSIFFLNCFPNYLSLYLNYFLKFFDVYYSSRVVFSLHKYRKNLKKKYRYLPIIFKIEFLYRNINNKRYSEKKCIPHIYFAILSIFLSAYITIYYLI